LIDITNFNWEDGTVDRFEAIRHNCPKSILLS
jgi:hypothetical protein